MKDPAFLFYSKDFYEGTRTMLPKERACFIDLLIYQHQHGPIPDDAERICLYCSGIDEATLKATLKAKFKLTLEGWINERLERVATDRKAYSEGQSVNGRIGQFWKKVKAKVSAKEMRVLKTLVYDEIGKEKFVQMMDEPKATLEGLLEGLLKHIANANAIVIDSDIPDISKAPPKIEEVVAYFLENGYTEDAAKRAWNYYNASLGERGKVWKDKNGSTVVNWKMKMQSVWFKDENKETEKPAFEDRNNQRGNIRFASPIL